MEIFDAASLIPHLDGSCGVTWLDREGEAATIRSRQFATRQEAEAFARGMGLEPGGPEMALGLMEPEKQEVFAAAKAGDWPRAEEHALCVLRVIPDDGDTHRLLGVVYLKQGQLDEAVAELETAVRLIPSDGAAQHNLGVAYGLQGRRDDAIAALTAAAGAGMDSAIGSDLLRVLEAVPERSPLVTELTKSAVRDFLAARRG